MITSTLINQSCIRVQGMLHPCTPLKSYTRLYYVSKSPRTGLVQRRHFASLHSSPRCVSSAAAAAAQEATTEQPSTLLPSHWVDHLAHLRPGERRALNRYIPLVSKVTALEPLMQQLTDDELAAYTTQFRARLASGESLQSLLPEAFAVVREAASRVLGMRHYDVQILGGIVLAQGQVAEMATGEGKTLVAALPAYLYALSGKGVHIVTVNDYLAQRDASWIGKILTFLGLHVGVVTSEASDSQRAVGFAADVTYITAYELAFTFLQDNLAPSTDAVTLRRPLHYAIVDEVDSILIDEARNPFIITVPDDSDSSTKSEEYWRLSIKIASLLQGPTSDQLSEDWSETGVPSEPLDFDYLPDYRSRIATLTQRGMERAVRALAMPEIDQIVLAQQIVDSDTTTTTTPTTTQNQGLYVVLLAPTADNTKLELTLRSAIGAAEASSSSSSSLDGCTVVLNNRTQVDSVLSSQFNLRSLSLPDITVDQLRAAAPAALWTGGDHAWGRYLNQAIRAQHLYYKDVHYIVKDGEVVIIDTATGRERHRSRWQSGLHQAIEAKEEAFGVKIKSEHYDKGRTTYQSLFNLYGTLCGMTGTAVTEAEEFSEAYNVSVVRVPPHRPSKRVDNPPTVYMGIQGWAKRVVEIVRAAAVEKRPVLMGTSSVEESELVLDLVANIPFQSTLTDTDVNRLERALAGLPNSLPPPLEFLLENGAAEKKLTEEEQTALDYHLSLMDLYESSLFITRRVCRSRRLTPEIGLDVDQAAKFLDFLSRGDRFEGRSSLLTREQTMECMEIADVLSQVINRSLLGKVVPINLLNARPDRARKEAQIIAQAGLPGTITVATAMAGRGTDILLGGNPKGLTLIALQYYLLPVLCRTADDLVDILPAAPPLQGLDLGIAFVSEADMRLHLPVPLYRAFVQAKEAAQEAYHQLISSASSTSTKEESGGSTSSSSSSSPSLLLPPGYGPVKSSSSSTTTTPSDNSKNIPRAQDVAELLSTLLESVEVDRSVFLLTMRRGDQTASLEAALEWTLNQQQQHSVERTITPTERALRRYALLQWLWFDAQCEKYATLVRAAGGLATVITSIQDTRRTERQLRGRAGRQGDPGETFMISHRNDPAVQSILSPAQMQGLWAAVEAQSSPEELVEPALMRVVLKTLTTTAEQQGLSARELTRKYDAAIDSYRRHVFTLRRTLAGGGDGARGVLAHRQLRRLVSELVLVYTENGRKHPKYWNIEELLNSLQKLFQRGDVSSGIGGGSSSISGLEAMEISNSIVQGTTDSSSEFDLCFQVEMDITSSAAVLKNALCKNLDLPHPRFINSAEEDDDELNISTTNWMPVRRRVAFQNARSYQITSQNTKKVHQLDNDASGGGGNESSKGRYAPPVARLQLYMGDLVTLLYEKKRRALAFSIYQRSGSGSGGGGTGGSLGLTTPLHVLSILRLWERDAMLYCIDSLWTDFLQDITTLQRAAMTRAFSQLDPVDEFRLEAAGVFARLLRDFRRQSAVALLAPVDIRDLEWRALSATEQQINGGGGGGSAGNVSNVSALDDVVWLADIMEEERRNDEEPKTKTSAGKATTATATTATAATPSGGELAAIEKLMARISQASSEELSAAIEKLDEKWKNNT